MLELFKECDVTNGRRRSQSSFMILAGWQLLAVSLSTDVVQAMDHVQHISYQLATTMVEITIRKRQREDAVLTQRKFFKKTARGKVVKGAQPSSSFTMRAFKRLASHSREISQGRCLLRNRTV